MNETMTASVAPWRTQRAAILERAAERCESCGVATGAFGARDRFGGWHDESDIHGMNSDTGMHYFGEDWDWKMIRIRLYVSELSYQALCQQCHRRWLDENAPNPQNAQCHRPNWSSRTNAPLRRREVNMTEPIIRVECRDSAGNGTSALELSKADYWPSDPVRKAHVWLIDSDSPRGRTVMTDDQLRSFATACLVALDEVFDPVPRSLDSSRLLECIEDLVWQFAYRGTWKGQRVITTGGLSTLKEAFGVLGWSEPHRYKRLRSTHYEDATRPTEVDHA